MIAQARQEMVQRSQGQSATHKGAYNGGEAVEDERTGIVFDYSGRLGVTYHDVLLPDSAPIHLKNVGLLWNAAEAAEKRKDSQVAREVVLALPADDVFTDEDRIELARTFAIEHFVSKGVAVQLDVHAPDEDKVGGAGANWHSHLLITTRRLGPEGLDRLKARDLLPVVRCVGGCGRVVEGDLWGELWRLHQERFCRERGYDLKVDLNGLISQNHVGPRRMRRAMSEPVLWLEARCKANRAATYEIDRVLDALTRHEATFTERDLHRFLVKQIGHDDAAAETITNLRAAVLSHPRLKVLVDPETGVPIGRFTTKEVRDEEDGILLAAVKLRADKTGAASARRIEEVKGRTPLHAEQELAFDRATAGGCLQLITGRAGTGKSHTLAAIREAHRNVFGLAPTNAVAQNLKANGFENAFTVHSALFQLKNGMIHWDKNTVVMVDEAAMISTPILKDLMDAAVDKGVKLILVGDERQLPSIDRTGMFPQLLEQHKDAVSELTEVMRQKIEWQRQAARDLAEYRFDRAVSAFGRAGAISWNDSKEDERNALVAAWKRDLEAWERLHPKGPDESRFVFAYTNENVDILNAKMRQVYREAGKLSGPDVVFDVSHKAAEPGEKEELHRTRFAKGDRIQFTRTEKPVGACNGDLGEIIDINARTGDLTARIDAPGGKTQIVRWNARAFNGFRHAYAGTIYKGQGKTFDRTYLLHSRHWTAAASYVALTRQRKGATIFVSRQTAANEEQLARQMARQVVRSASIAWPTQETFAGAASAVDALAQTPLRTTVKRDGGLAPLGAKTGLQKPIPDPTAGQEGFRQRLDLHRQEKQTAVDRIRERGLLRDWDQHFAKFGQAAFLAHADPARYTAARAQLLEFMQSLNDRPGTAALLRGAAIKADPARYVALVQALDHPEPAKALDGMISEAERELQEREAHLEEARRPTLDHRDRRSAIDVRG